MISLSIHTDFHGRFPDSHHLCSYAGLIPSPHSSGGITYHGSMTKRGSKYLRWIMLECVHVHIRTNKSSNITQFYTRLAKSKGNSKAAVAAASKNSLLCNERKKKLPIIVKGSYHIRWIEKKVS